MSSVVFPAPEGPTTLTVSPADSSRSMPRRISTAPAAPVSVTLSPCSDTMGRSDVVAGMAGVSLIPVVQSEVVSDRQAAPKFNRLVRGGFDGLKCVSW